MIVDAFPDGGEIFRLFVGPYPNGELRVHAFGGKEAISRLYRFDIEVTSQVGLEGALERAVLGHRAALSIRLGRVHRDFHGIICGAEALGRQGAEGKWLAAHRLRLVPKAWVMTKRRNTRIFQNQRVDQVIGSVLKEAGVPARFRLERTYPVRKYCTQYNETDYEFVTRLAAENGFYFYFSQPPGMVDETGAQIFGSVQSLLGGAVGQIGGEGGAIASAVAPIVGNALGNSIAGALGLTIEGEMMVFSDNPMCYPSLDDEYYTPGDLAAAITDQLTQAAGSLIDEGTEELADAANELLPGAGAAVSAGVDMAVDALKDLITDNIPVAPLVVREESALEESTFDSLTTFKFRRELRASNSVYIEFDPKRPNNPYLGKARADGLEVMNEALGAVLGAATTALAGEIGGEIGGALGGAAGGLSGAAAGAITGALAQSGVLGEKTTDAPIFMEVYDHHGDYHFPEHREATEEARRNLRQARRRAHSSHGTSRCSRLCAGRKFHLDDHPLGHLKGDYVLVSVKHVGASRQGLDQLRETYTNTFQAVPADVVYLPRRPRRRVTQNCLTATVVGPAGEDVHVNDQGEIKVKFHWDRAAHGANSSCWIRAMQSWGGTGWGTQFIPRVGMEVVVAFDGGDPDRPIVLGSLYNGIHPTAFKLPAQKTRSGIRTSSIPGGGGYNEISFDDAAAKEQIFVRAQRDLDVVVENVRRANVKVDDQLEVTKDRSEKVGRNRSVVVAGDATTRVTGNRMLVVTGEASERFEGDASVRVSGSTNHELAGNARLSAEGEVVVHVRGSATTVVGRHDAKRNYVLRVEGKAQISSSGATEISSEKEILLRCGDSCLRIATDKIELISPEVSIAGDGARLLLGDGKSKLKVDGTSQVVAEAVILKSSGASIGLSSEAKIDGSRVLLNSPESASDNVESDEAQPTQVSLTDDEGNPLARQPFRVVLDDGSEITGITDDEGRADIELEGSGTIFFPETGSVEGG
jgi:type VI secretion system secreted protein VgrG